VRRGAILTAWTCPHEESGLCRKVAGAYCRPGMKGCVLVGKVRFQDGVIPSPVWPEEARPGRRPPAEEDEER
jgi:hypothetical protein